MVTYNYLLVLLMPKLKNKTIILIVKQMCLNRDTCGPFPGSLMAQTEEQQLLQRVLTSGSCLIW